MGGRGNSGKRNSNSTPIKLGESIQQLEKYTDWKTGAENIRKDFNLEFATQSQIETIRSMMKGILEYDYQYHEKDKPFNIVHIEIKKLMTSEDFEKDKTITIHITTRPNVDNAYIRMADTKYRDALLGSGGGFYTFNKNYNKTSIRKWDMLYGKREL